MIRRLVTRDSVAVTGSIIGLSSLLFGWLTLKPSRLAAGTSLSLWESVGWGSAAVILCLWLICFALSLMGKRRLHAIILGIAANLIFVITFVLVGLVASRLIEEGTAFARVSLGAGIWTASAGAFWFAYCPAFGLVLRLPCPARIRYTGCRPNASDYRPCHLFPTAHRAKYVRRPAPTRPGSY